MEKSLVLVSFWLALSVFLIGCSSESPYPYEIPNESKQVYQFDCQEYCDAEAICLAVPDDSQCDTLCSSYKEKGALQSSYLDARVECVETIEGQCGQSDLDACRDFAMALCSPTDSVRQLEENWCSRWLDCNGSPVDRYLSRCLHDLESYPDTIMLSCMSAEAVEMFLACVQDARCEDVIDLPLLTLCSGVYK